jgi:pyruvate dehydrogenase E2 component (dihydrolipoamide acetyltransferase)
MSMSEIVMPRLSDTMEEGTILRWLKADGESVRRGEELVEIETDKATMIYESDQEGTLTLVAAEGDTLPVGATIARVGADGASATTEPAAAAQQPADGAARERPARASAPVDPQQAGAQRAPERPPAQPQPDGDGSAAPGPDSEQGRGVLGRIRASPLARRLARERGVDLQTLTGSGPGGRIVKADVLGSAGEAPGGAPAVARGAGSSPAQAPEREREPAGAAGLGSVETAKGQTSELRLSRIQQTVARRMAESKATIPDFTMLVEVDMEECVALREELKRVAAAGAGPAPTYNDMVVKACALALREFPQANGSYRDGRVQLHSRVNVGVAVAAEASLVVPTVFDAAEKSLGEIARETRSLAQRVRDGSITPPELGGGTFTVSNLGMYGVRSFTAIVNPPQAAIMSVGTLEPRAVVRDGSITARNTLSLTLVCDHRILYGAEAAGFLARVRELLQTPAALTL